MTNISKPFAIAAAVMLILAAVSYFVLDSGAGNSGLMLLAAVLTAFLAYSRGKNAGNGKSGGSISSRKPTPRKR